MLVTDDRDSIIDQRNFNLPESADSLPPWVITPANEAYLRSKLARLKSGTNVIHISIAPGWSSICITRTRSCCSV